MDTTVKALQNLFAALGGEAATVNNVVTIPDMVNAIANLISGRPAAPELVISPTTTSVAVGSKSYIAISKNTTGSSVAWESTDTSIATVAAGVVTGVKAGKCYIIAKTGGSTAGTVGLTATCEVTVTAS